MTFKEFITKSKEELENKIQVLTTNPNFSLFFTKDKDVFAAPEEGRIMFANMKEPEEDAPKNWKDDANFLAYNLSKMVKGENSYKEIVDFKELKKIKVVDQDKAAKYLMRKVI